MTVKDTELEDGKKTTEPKEGEETELDENGNPKNPDGKAELVKKEGDDPEPGKKVEEDNSKKTALGLIQKAEQLIKDGKEVPKDLLWTLPQIDVESIKPSEDENKEEESREVWYAKTRDEERYNEVKKLIKEEYDEKQVDTIEAKVDSLVENYSMPKMEAFNLTIAGLGESQKQKLDTRLKNQTFSPPRFDSTKPKEDDSGFKKASSDMKERFGIEIDKESYDKAEKEGLF